MRRYLITIILAVALALAFQYLKQLHLAFAVVLALACAPLMAWLCAPVFMDLAAGWIGFSEHAARGASQGNYYSFDERRIRFLLVNETIWVAESDLAGILVQAMTEHERRQLGGEYGVVPGKRIRGFTEISAARR